MSHVRVAGKCEAATSSDGVKSFGRADDAPFSIQLQCDNRILDRRLPLKPLAGSVNPV